MKPFNELSESDTIIEVQPVVAEVEEDRPSKPAGKPIQKPVAPAPLAPVTPVEQIANINSERGVFVPWPKKVMGLYILLADDDHEGLETVQDFSYKLSIKPQMHLVEIELVSKELNHFGMIAGLFRQIGGHSSKFELFCSF